MPVKPDAKLLTALLSSCYFHKNVELAKSIGKRLLELEPREARAYMLLSNFYGQIGDLEGKLQHYQNEEAIFGAFSLIFWTLTLMPLLKYVIIVLSADDNGEGGTFALYSLLCRYMKFSLLPNQQAADEELSAYNYEPLSLAVIASSPLKRFLDKHKKLRTTLLVVLFAACMLIGDGVLTPVISGVVTSLACIILVGLFAVVVWFNVFHWEGVSTSWSPGK
ncbi:hypothetical protein GIB67_016445 [Kingdonia uniflora]|uniref:K+ potassium transporter integral membrane domain-containing protein n=1 Tax=Kingdonia uniflora TaxID=39325 RepID=A0A7J7MH15_9MAGN|nr:hypothetical protein GIB67_016445 [Kingdonia uniflora]